MATRNQDDPLSLFDPKKARGGRAGPDVGRDVTAEVVGAKGAGPLSVSALVARIKSALAAAFPARVIVVGEISNLNRHTSGHLYFRLKDAGASIDAVMFRPAAMRLRFAPADGLEVFAEGRVDVYEARGQLQLYVERLTPKGAGALELAFRQLKDKLQRDGLFGAAAKVPIPRFPRAIGVITSPTGAAIRDIRRALARRWPAAAVYLLPVLVQGDQAAGEIAQAIGLMDSSAGRLRIDTIILARGGGSLEDLWAFNEEVVARAIFACRTPIITGIGHEVDVTIADLVADLRAATPTAAAEQAVPDQAAIRQRIQTTAVRLYRLASQAVEAGRADLKAIRRSVVFRDPASRLRAAIQRLDELSHRLRGGLREGLSAWGRRLEPLAGRLAALHPARLHERARASVDRLLARLAWALGGRSKRAGDALAAVEARMQAVHPRHRLALAGQKVQATARQLEAMSYRSVLNRGYSVTRLAGDGILRSAGQVGAGAAVETELADGRFISRVEGPAGRAEPPAEGAGAAAPPPVPPALPAPPVLPPALPVPPAPPVPRRGARPSREQGPTLFGQSGQSG